jgi:hypothetical protein
MSEFSSQFNLAEQSKLGKKEWNKVVNHAATAVAECLKEKSLTLNIITPKHYQYAMQESFKIYHGRAHNGLIDPQFTNQPIMQKILYLKRKKQEADELKRERGNIGEYGIKVMNRLAARTDDDLDLYNAQVVPELDKLIVPYKDYQYRDSPYIDRNFVTSQKIEQLLKNKFQKNSKVKKTDAEIEAILTTTQNLINKTENPQLSLQSLANSSPNDSIFNDIVDNTNAQSEIDIEQAEEENNEIDALMNNSSSSSISSSSSSGSGVDYGFAKKRFKPDNSIDDENDLTLNLFNSNYNNVNNDPNAMSSGMPPPSYINPATLNPNLINPI